MALTRDRILSQKLKTREVHVPEWADGDPDDVVIVRELSAKEQDAYQAAISLFSGGEVVGMDQNNMTAKLLVRCIIDENGERLFPDDNDAEKIGNLPGTGAAKLMNAVLQLSGMTEQAQGEIEGNSEAAPSGAPSSDSLASTGEPPTSS